MRRRPMCFLCILLMCGICAADWFGLSLFRERPLTAGQEQEILGKSVAVQGILQEKVEKETSFSIYLKDTFLTFQSTSIPIENIKIYMDEKVALSRGTRVKIEGVLHCIEKPRNPGEFDNPIYYETQGIYYTMAKGKLLGFSENPKIYEAGMERLKNRLSLCFQEIAGKHAGIFQAMLLGDKNDLDAQVKNQYQMAGIIHILAISGLHLSILGTGLYKVLKRLGAGNGLAGVVALCVIIQYGVLTGSSVATMRSVVMFLIGIGAKISGRSYDLLSSLAAAAILILLERPACLYYSGFLLSFGAVLGLGWVLPVFQETMGENPIVRPFLGAFSVHVVMIPLLLYFFSEVSILGIFLNLLVIPTVAGVLVCGLLGAAAGIFSLGLGKLLILPGRCLLEIYQGLGALCCRLPFCTWVGGKPEIWQIVIYYLAVFLLVEVLRRTNKQKKKWKIWRRGMLVTIYLFVLILLSWKDRSGLRITFLDVGQGDGIVWETEGGGCYLVDGGSTSQSMVGMYKVLPYVKSRGISRIQAAFITHTDEDHCNGIMEILEAQTAHTTSVRIERLILPDWEEKPQIYIRLLELAQAADVPVSYVGRGDVMAARELKLSILNPGTEVNLEDINGGSIVIQADYGKFRGMFTGDIGEKQEREILTAVSKCTVLKVAHHGSKNSSCEEFLERVDPAVSVVSVAERNLYHHPHPDAVARLNRWSGDVLMTKDGGAVLLWTDGRKMKIESFTEK